VLDYEIFRARSDRLDWYLEKRPEEKKGETMFRAMVLVHRKGDFVFAVDVLIKFNSGESVTEHWDGKDRWVRYTYDKKAKVVSAEIDPEHAVLLDKNFYNNSYVREEDATAKWKIVSYMAHSWPFCGVAEVCWLWVGGNSLLAC
jgi:hypothetical protein